jgi:hypothetical protein
VRAGSVTVTALSGTIAAGNGTLSLLQTPIDLPNDTEAIT